MAPRSCGARFDLSRAVALRPATQPSASHNPRRLNLLLPAPAPSGEPGVALRADMSSEGPGDERAAQLAGDGKLGGHEWCLTTCSSPRANSWWSPAESAAVSGGVAELGGESQAE